MTRAHSASTYDEDSYAWTQEQAAALRRVPPGGLDFELDVAHVAEEIEDLGKRDLREVMSFLAHLLEHLIEIDSHPSSRDVPHWRGEVRNFHASALEAFSPGMRRALDMDQIWRMTRRRIDAAAEKGLDPRMPERPSFTVDELLVENFDLNSALAKVAAARAAEGRP